MPNTKTIGATGRDYATFALYASYLDGQNTLSTPEIGEFYNDAEFSETSVTLTGYVTDATNNATIRPATGQGFAGHASKLTNRLAYVQANGAALTCTAAYTAAFRMTVGNTTLQGLQIKGTSFVCSSVVRMDVSTCVLDGCICQQDSSFSSTYLCIHASRGTVKNCLAVVTSATAMSGMGTSYGANFYGCTVVRGSNRSAAGTGISCAGTVAIKNCAVFGFTTDQSGGTLTSTTNATDDTTPTTGFTGSLTYANQFVATDTSGNYDFRSKTGSNLIDAGTTDATNMPTDIVGTARPQGSSYDIGCWELAASGGPSPHYTRRISGGLISMNGGL